MESIKKLTIIVSTLNQGINGIGPTICLEDDRIEYLIVFQNTVGLSVPKHLNRKDVRVIESKERGLAISRNIGLENCRTPYAIIADDDVKYINAGLDFIFNNVLPTDFDVATFKIKTLEGEKEYKSYPEESYNLIENKHWISSVEMLINVPKIKEAGLKFDRRFGLGAKIPKSEELVFISDCKSKGLNCIYFPEYLVEHPFESSGKKVVSKFKEFFYLGAIYGRIGVKKRRESLRTIQGVKDNIAYYWGKCFEALTRFKK